MSADPSAPVALPKSTLPCHPKIHQSEIRHTAPTILTVDLMVFYNTMLGWSFNIESFAKHRRMLKKIPRILFAGLITLSLVSQGTAVVADLCAPMTTASADAMAVLMLDSAHGAHAHPSATTNHSGAESTDHATSGSDCCGDLFCSIDNCAASAKSFANRSGASS